MRMLLEGTLRGRLDFGASLPGVCGFRSCGFPTVCGAVQNEELCNYCAVENSLLQGRVLLSLDDFIWEIKGSDCRYFPCL